MLSPAKAHTHNNFSVHGSSIANRYLSILNFNYRARLMSNCFAIELKGGKEMSIEIAYVVVGVMILVGAIVGAGIIYSGLQLVANAIKKQEN